MKENEAGRIHSKLMMPLRCMAIARPQYA